MVTQQGSDKVKLTEEQEKEGYRVEDYQNSVLVWHKKNQILLFSKTPDVDRRVQEVVERSRRELKEVEEKTGWKANR